MLRALFFLAITILPVLVSWWLFIPLALLYVYLAKFPYEMVIAGLILDTVYYFGGSFFWQHFLALYSFALIIIAFFLNEALRWEKRI